MKNLSKTKKILIVCVILNFLAWGSYGALFWKIKSDNQKISKLLSEAEQNSNKEEVLRQAKKSLGENEKFIQKIDTYFIPSDGVVEFINSFESLARASGVNVIIGSVSVEPDGKSADDFKEVLRLKAQALGTWGAVYNFLSIIENLPYRVNILQADISLNSDSRSGNANTAGSGWKGDFEFTLLKLK